jgi:hypothetical protein
MNRARMLAAILPCFLLVTAAVPTAVAEVKQSAKAGGAKPTPPKPAEKPAEKPVPEPATPAPSAATNEAAKPAPEAAPAPGIEARPIDPATRITHVIRERSVPEAHVEKLKALQKYIAKLDQYKSGSKLSAGEIKQFRETLHNAGLLIFCEEQLPNGSALQLFRYSINVALRPEVLKKLEGDALTREDMQAITRNICRLLQLRAALVSPDYLSEERAALQAEYASLLNKYFGLQAGAPKD